MECRIFEITLISATDLQHSRRILRNPRVYATVSIGGPNEKRSPTDHHGGPNPAWNFTMKFTLRESMVHHCNTMMVVKLFRRRIFGRDRYIGEVHTSISELFGCARLSGGSAVLCFPVMKGCVASQGSVKFSYRFGEKVIIDKLLMAESIGGWIRC